MLFKDIFSGKVQRWNWMYPVLGVLVYYGLFSSVNAASGFYPSDHLQDNEGLVALSRSWKIIVFAITQLLISRYARELKSRLLIVGPVLAFLSSLILQAGVQSYLFAFFIQAIESIGESFTASAVAYYIREETACEDWSYFGNTTLWRLGTLVGLLLAVTVGGDFAEAYPKGNPVMLSVMRLAILALVITCLIRGERGLFLRQIVRSRGPETRALEAVDIDRSVLADTFRLDALLGAFTNSLFYILVFSPIVLYEQFDAIQGNCAFAILVVILIWVYAKYKLKTKADTPNVLFFQLWSVTGLIFVVMLWGIALLIDQSPALTMLGAVYGFFSMAVYQLSEVAVGTTGLRKDQGKRIVRFMGMSKIGQIFGVVGPLILVETYGKALIIVYLLLALVGIGVVSYHKLKAYRTLLMKREVA